MPHRSSDRRLARDGLGHAGASARPDGALVRSVPAPVRAAVTYGRPLDPGPAGPDA